VSDEFYVGYSPQMPAAMARRVRVAAAMLMVLAVTVPALLISAQKRFATGRFEFGEAVTLEGRLVEFPYPALDVRSTAGPAKGFYWLVGPGKHGAAALVRGLDGRLVRVRGTRIERDGEAMLQIEAGGVERTSADAGAAPAPTVRIRTVRIAGEIVDSKCHLGVMKPGEGPTHRDCAVRCLLGDVPPMLLVHGASDLPRRLALLDEQNRPFTADFVALAGRPITIAGTLVTQGARIFLSARASDIEFMR
jgi:hypothetical protein